MKIFLINPKTLFPGKTPPLPLGLIQAGALPYIDSHEVDILDCNISSIHKIKRKIKNQNPDIIGFTTKTGKSLQSCIQLSKFTKENSDATVVWGGVHASLLPSQVIKENYVDIVVIGEGDFTFNEVVDNLKDLSKIRGITYKKDNKVFMNPPKDIIQNLDSLPLIQWDLIDIKKYVFKWVDNVKTMFLPTSRGCPYKCTFCYNPVFHKSIWRPFSLNRIKENLDNLISYYQIGGLKVDYEDNFIGNDIERTLNISKLFEKYGLKWACQARVNELNRRILKEFKNNGCEYIFIGVESGSQRILNFLKKGVKVSKIKETFDLIDELKIRAVASFILDIPSETYYDFHQTIKLAKKLNAIITAGFYQPFPGTELFNWVVRNGLFDSPKSAEGWSTKDYSDCYGFSDISFWKLRYIYYYLNYWHNTKILIKNKDYQMFYLLFKSIIDSSLQNFSINT